MEYAGNKGPVALVVFFEIPVLDEQAVKRNIKTKTNNGINLFILFISKDPFYKNVAYIILKYTHFAHTSLLNKFTTNMWLRTISL
jgi:hypothetical protein